MVDSTVIYRVAIGGYIYGCIPGNISLVGGNTGDSGIGSTGTLGKLLEIYIVEVGIHVTVRDNLESEYLTNFIMRLLQSN